MLTDKTTQSAAFTDIVRQAVDNRVKIILLHHVDFPFPSYQDINALSPMVKTLFESIAIPYQKEYVEDVWDRIIAKLFNVTKEPPQTLDWFLSHKQSTGQQIALPIYLELKEYENTAFLDIKAEFDLHDLEKLVERAKYYLLILTPDIFKSGFCLKGILIQLIISFTRVASCSCL